MKLQNKRALQDEYYCELTTKLDELAGITENLQDMTLVLDIIFLQNRKIKSNMEGTLLESQRKYRKRKICRG